MQQYTEVAATRNRFDNVDVLSLLDANWLEHSQASGLMKLVEEAKRSGNFEDRRDAEAA